MSTTAQPLFLSRPRPRPRSRRRRRSSPRLLAVALLPGAASAVDAVPAIDARAAQGRLVDLGFLSVRAVTGTWNPPTVDAVRRFQADSGLEPSGVAGAVTVGRLLAASPRAAHRACAHAA